VLQPAHYNFVVKQATTWQSVFTLYQGDTTTPVVNLTGYTATLTIKDSAGDSAPLLTLTSGSGITLGGTAGTITVLQSADQTTAYTWASGEYRLTLTSPSGTTDCYLYGQVTIERF
jgi:hypothetical protein